MTEACDLPRLPRGAPAGRQRVVKPHWLRAAFRAGVLDQVVMHKAGCAPCCVPTTIVMHPMKETARGLTFIAVCKKCRATWLEALGLGR